MSEPGMVFFYTVVTPDGIALVRSPDTPWPEHIGVSHQLMELGDPEYMTAGDGMLRFMLPDGDDALYGYAHEEPRKVTHFDLIRAGAVTA